MRQTSLLSLLLLVAVSFGVAGGCNNNNGGGGNDDELETPEGAQYDIDLAIELMALSAVAYQQRLQCISGGKSAITVPAPYTLEEVIFESESTPDEACMDDDTVIPFAFIATMGDNIYLTFRGTETFADEVADVAALQIPYDFIQNGGKASLGFIAAYQGDNTNPIQSTIMNKLNELTMTGNFSSLFITGHSLGAAVAVVAFPDLATNLAMIDNVTMYNFAGPAVGDTDFVSAYEAIESDNRISFRVLNTNDLVPMLPPLGLDCTNFSYFHAGAQETITFGTQLPALPDFAAADCSVLTIGLELGLYGELNKDAIGENHDHCTYLSTLCAMGSDPSSCSQTATDVGCGS